MKFSMVQLEENTQVRAGEVTPPSCMYKWIVKYRGTYVYLWYYFNIIFLKFTKGYLTHEPIYYVFSPDSLFAILQDFPNATPVFARLNRYMLSLSSGLKL